MVATAGSVVTSWIWALLVVTQAEQAARSGTDEFLQIAIVAVPLALAAAGRVAAGIFTDRYGARVVLPVISVATAVPLVAAGTMDSMPTQAMLACAAGVTGTMFPVGAAAVARVYPPGRRGLTLATYGTGSLCGLMAAALTWPPLLDAGHTQTVRALAAVLLLACAALAAVLLRDRSPEAAEPVSPHAVRKTLRNPSVSRVALLYAVTFGPVLAIVFYLPAYLRADYGLVGDPATGLTVACLVVAAVTRPLGGWLADRACGGPTLVVCFAVAGVCALVQAFPPPLPWGALTLGGAALCLGVASGTVLALIGVLAPVGREGVVAGAVSAVGAAAAAVPPVLMYVTYTLDRSFGIALTVMAALLVGTATGVRRWRSLLGVPTESAAVSAATGILLDEFDPSEFLHRVTGWCADLPEIDAAGLLLVAHHGHLTVVASSMEQNALTRLLEIQDEQSPSRECLRTAVAVHHGDLAAATRWPRFAHLAVLAGFGSVQAVPMRLRGRTIGVLTLLSRQSGALNDTEGTVQALVDLAAISLVHEHAVREPVLVATQRQALLHGRVVIEQAKGVLAARLGVDMDTAFTLLRGHDRPLIDMARNAINGWLPPTRTPDCQS